MHAFLVYTTNMASTRRYEKKVTRGEGLVVGIDEVGRGAWAGPMVAVAVAIPRTARVAGVRDSKSLNEMQREEMAHAIHAVAATWAYGVVSNKEIDAYGLTEANRLVFVRALKNLHESPAHALVDGKVQYQLPCTATYIVRGDQREFLIAAASILAKVFRDRLMRRVHGLYPAYGFVKNKGYGTRAHTDAIRNYGVTPLHRMSFLSRVRRMR